MASKAPHAEFDRVVLREFVEGKGTVHRAAQKVGLCATRRFFFGIVSKRGTQPRFRRSDATVSATVALSDGVEDKIRVPGELKLKLSATVCLVALGKGFESLRSFDERSAAPDRPRVKRGFPERGVGFGREDRVVVQRRRAG